jgi:hypothetical protein
VQLAGRPFVNQPGSDEAGSYGVQIKAGTAGFWILVATRTADRDAFSLQPREGSGSYLVVDVRGAFRSRGWTARIPPGVIPDGVPLKLRWVAEFTASDTQTTIDRAPDRGTLGLG